MLLRDSPPIPTTPIRIARSDRRSDAAIQDITKHLAYLTRLACAYIRHLADKHTS